jgi:hypothetical protein
MYATVQDVQNILPPTMSVGDQNIGTPSPGRPDIKRSQLTPAIINNFIRLAQQEVDSRLRNFYACPLRRVKMFEVPFLLNLSAGSDVIVKVEDSSNFNPQDTVRIQDDTQNELATITSITSGQILVLNALTNSYISDNNGLISIVKFPDPIPLITARLAVGLAFDKLFNAEQAPDISKYGEEQRKEAKNSIDSILSGTVLLFGQELTGRRFVRGSLFDAFGSPTKDFQFGREKS